LVLIESGCVDEGYCILGGADHGSVENRLAYCVDWWAVLAAVFSLVSVTSGPGNHRVVTSYIFAVNAEAVAPKICSVKPSAHRLCRSSCGTVGIIGSDERGVGGKGPVS